MTWEPGERSAIRADIACVTRRTASNVNSLAMMARQPEVPNFIILEIAVTVREENLLG
jgi:hypothetical protein